MATITLFLHSPAEAHGDQIISVFGGSIFALFVALVVAVCWRRRWWVRVLFLLIMVGTTIGLYWAPYVPHTFEDTAKYPAAILAAFYCAPPLMAGTLYVCLAEWLRKRMHRGV